MSSYCVSPECFALMTGAFADLLRFIPWLIVLVLWQFLVYSPWCHLIWGGGYFMTHGVVDFAGGIVVHTTAVFSALACIKHVTGTFSFICK